MVPTTPGTCGALWSVGVLLWTSHVALNNSKNLSAVADALTLTGMCLSFSLWPHDSTLGYPDSL
eukprot:8843-Pelagomonas_calceolata.AAC.5